MNISCVSTSCTSPLLDQQDMHRRVPKNQHRATNNSKTNDIRPESLSIEPKRGQNARARHLNIKAVFMVNQTLLGYLIDQ